MATWKTTARVWDSKAGAYVTVHLALDIDWQRIADTMAPKAYRNKTRRTALVAGAIKAEIVSK